jgi:hypothetical protein
VPWETCASCWGSPSRTTLRAACATGDGVGERDLAGLVDEQDVDGLALVLPRPVPRGGGHEPKGPPSSGSSEGRRPAQTTRALA